MIPETISVIAPVARTARLPQILDALVQQQVETAIFETWIVCKHYPTMER